MKAIPLRALLVLGRVSNLPTVWSNCLAGWVLGDRGCPHRLPFLITGASFLYVAGMFLNDAFDVAFDREYRKERPVPSGVISARAVWICGFAMLLLGAGLLFGVSGRTGIFGLIFAAY